MSGLEIMLATYTDTSEQREKWDLYFYLLVLNCLAKERIIFGKVFLKGGCLTQGQKAIDAVS